ncbi:MAG: hypothetical protein KBA53_06525 [Thermoclostridium sp.]|nr:hypothetical protein [Thermoclostridium sp.]
MPKRKIILSALLVLLLFIATFLNGSLKVLASPAGEEVTLEVSSGFGGIAKLGAWSPIQVKINAPGRSISGELQVEASLDQARKIIIARPIELKTGAEESFSFEIPVVSAKRSVSIRLVEGKKTLAEEDYSFTRLLPPEVMLIGVLSDDPEAFGYLNGNTIPVASDMYYDEKMKVMMASGQVPIGPRPVPMPDSSSYQKRQAVVVSLNRDSFPEKAEVIDGFDFIMINQFDTSLLSELQMETLETWVDSGGVLMLGTGMNWQKVYHGLPDSLKLFDIDETTDYESSTMLQGFSGKNASSMTLRLAKGTLGFEYLSPPQGSSMSEPTRWLDNDIFAGNAQNPLVIKYRKEMGSVLVYTFDPAAEPFVSWAGRTAFFENTFKFIGTNFQKYYEMGNGYYQRQVYNSNNLQHLVTEVPSDKKLPFVGIFATLGIYILIAGPVLYIILKKMDKRDWAWVLIPALSILFLGGMYVLGFKTRYHSAVLNTVSVVQVSAGGNEAVVSSAIGVFNDRRGTLKLEYNTSSGLNTPFIQNNDYYGYRNYGDNIEGQVVGKYTMGQPAIFEQYDVMLWTPMVLNAEKTIPFGGDVLKDLYLKGGKLMGSITNTTPYDLLDTVVIVGNHIIPVGDILAGEPKQVDIALDSKQVYKRPDEYLDGYFGRNYYNNPKDIPSNFQEMMRRRNLFESYINQGYGMQTGETKFSLLARNSQEIDYGLTVNDKQPQQYNQNLIRAESPFSFKPGWEVEIPAGIIMANMYQTKEVGWQDGNYGIRVNNTGEMEFQFNLPGKLSVTGFTLSVENYIPLYVKYNMEDNSNNGGVQTEVLSNKYEYALYNVKTGRWDSIEAKIDIDQDAYRYIGSGNEVRMKVTVVELGMALSEEDYAAGIYKQYEQELLGMPEISVRGVAK